MDWIPDYDTLAYWLENYGSISLFFMLALGIIALPVPEESLMILAGVFIHKGVLGPLQTAFAGLCGSVAGITVSYLIGRWAGHHVMTRLHWLGMGDKKLRLVHEWFERYGKWTLFIGYFIPGIRHFTGIAAGMTDLSYRQFALFAYCGALFWVSTFLTIGYFFGGYGLPFFEDIEISVESIGLFVILLGLLYGAFYLYKNRKIDSR